MPKQSKNIERFVSGMITSIDKKDLDDEASQYSMNIYRDEMGRLLGIPDKTVMANIAYDVLISEWINKDGTEYDLVYSNGNAIKVFVDVYGTPSVSTLLNVNGTSIVSHNKEVHIGCGTSHTPKWIGYISYGQFGGAVPTGLQIYDAGISLIQGSSTGQVDWGTIGWIPHSTDTGDYYQANHTYKWKFSAVYDGYQESVLGTVFAESLATGQSVQKVFFQLIFHGFTGFNKRITGINVYRSVDDAAYMQCQYIDIVDLTYTGTLTNGTWSLSGSDYIYNFPDQGWDLNGANYEANSGLSDTTDEVPIVNYTLSAQLNGCLYIANCFTSDIPDASNYIFQSNEGSFDVFDIVNKNLRIADVPKAMIAFQGRLYIFVTNRIYVINPQGFYVENIYNGAGAYSPRSIYATQFGLFFADKNNCYMYDGKSYLPIAIGDAIKLNSIDGSIIGWQGMKHEYFDPVISYDSKYGVVLFITSENKLLNQRVDVFAYNVSKQSWDYYKNFCSATGNYGIFSGKDGETYSADAVGGYLYANFGASNNRAWEYWTKEYTLNEPSQFKYYYNLYLYKIETSGTVTPYYSIDGGTTWKTLTNITEIKNSDIADGGTSNTTYTNIIDGGVSNTIFLNVLDGGGSVINGSSWETAKSIVFRFVGTTGINRLDSASLIYRSKVGVR